MRISYRLAFAIMVASPAVGAQPTPDDPDSVSAQLSYQSAFAGYRPFRESEVPAQASWRAINEQAAQVGGHAGQIKDDEAAQEEVDGKSRQPKQQ